MTVTPCIPSRENVDSYANMLSSLSTLHCIDMECNLILTVAGWMGPIKNWLYWPACRFFNLFENKPKWLLREFNKLATLEGLSGPLVVIFLALSIQFSTLEPSYLPFVVQVGEASVKKRNLNPHERWLQNTIEWRWDH